MLRDEILQNLEMTESELEKICAMSDTHKVTVTIAGVERKALRYDSTEHCFYFDDSQLGHLFDESVTFIRVEKVYS